MEYSLREAEPGVFEIMQTRPVAVGSFNDLELAQRIVAFLQNDTAPGTPRNEIIKTAPQPKTVPEAPLPTVYFDWTDEALAKAFPRLAAGEKVRDVADSFNLSWTVLRGKWAAHKKRQTPSVQTSSALVVPGKQAVTALEKVTAAVSQLSEQEQCCVCGTYFKPTPENLDHCARCTHGA
ncbi:hypothetical protein [Epibacterium ulvae]|uniref:hypothetical protein n=1 Tax=Epibacterium ulvae TaxID=1156985 RepID=UPI00249281B5|nr:hypothetical protein [Epibacterium ulvae]